MKVLIVVKDLSIGGVSNVIFSYYDMLKYNPKIHMDIASGLPIEDRYMKKIKQGNSKLFIMLDRDKKLKKYIKELRDIIQKEKYEVVHVHGNSALIFPELLAAKMGGAKIRIAHGHNTTCNHPYINAIVWPFFDSLCTKRVACGKKVGKWMFHNKPFTVLKNGICLEKYIYSDIVRRKTREKLGIEDKFVVGHVGAFNYIKNQEFLLRIFAQLTRIYDNAVLLLVGTGELITQVSNYAKTLCIEKNVIFYGVSENVASLMMAMDVFTLTSRFEGLPCVLIEAQALGLPCVVSNKVSKEAKLTVNYEICELNDSYIDIWVRAILKFLDFRIGDNRNSHSDIKQAGYDMNDCAKCLLDIYTCIGES